jgi:hypothetical protein
MAICSVQKRRRKNGPSFFRALACSAGLSVVSAAALSQQISVDKDDCANGVHLKAKNARLSEVLKRLSQTLDFQLQYDSANDPIINADMTRRAPELVAKLAPSDNIMVTQAADPRCRGQSKIVKVWVLPTANATARTPPPSPARQPIVPQASQPYTPAQLDEMSRKRKAAFDAYVKEHGVPPPPEAD